MMTDDMIVGSYLALLAIGLFLYIVPIVIAFIRRHPSRWLIFVITVVFGATLLGWLVAFIWSLHAIHRGKGGSRGGESGLNIFENDPVSVRLVPNAPTDVKGESRPRAPHSKIELQSQGKTMIGRGHSIQWAADMIERLGRLRKMDALDEVEFQLLKQAVLEAL